MKTLYLLRHAKSSWKDTHLSDHQRPLNGRGQKQVRLLAHSDAFQQLDHVKFYASDAMRARQTIQGLMKEGHRHAGIVFDKDLYTFEPLDLVHWLKNRSDNVDIMVVGHNPALAGLIEYLVPESADDFPTAAWIELKLHIDRWDQLTPFCAEVQNFFIPAMLNHSEFQKRVIDGEDKQSGVSDYPYLLEAYRQPAMIGQDAEFLHQFRIYARRLKGILALPGTIGVERDRQRDQLKVHLKQVIQLSNPVRDLDVFLESLARWQKKLDKPYQRGLKALIHRVEHDRARFYQPLLSYLSGDVYVQNQALLVSYTEALDAISCSDHAQSRCMNETVCRQHESVEKKLNQLSPASDDKRFHRLRLQVKNLISSQAILDQFSASELERLGLLKKQLGLLQDACVQQQHLLQYAASDPGNDAMLYTVEELLHRLRKKKQRIKNTVCSLSEA